MPMLGLISGDNIKFRNLGAIVSLTIYNVPTGATTLTFTAPNNKITGQFSIADGSADEPSIMTSASSGTDNQIVFTFNRRQNMTFRIPLPVGAIDGFSISFNDAANTTKTVSRQIQLNRNAFVLAPDLNLGSTVTWEQHPTPTHLISHISWTGMNGNAGVSEYDFEYDKLGRLTTIVLDGDLFGEYQYEPRFTGTVWGGGEAYLYKSYNTLWFYYDPNSVEPGFPVFIYNYDGTLSRLFGTASGYCYPDCTWDENHNLTVFSGWETITYSDIPNIWAGVSLNAFMFHPELVELPAPILINDEATRIHTANVPASITWLDDNTTTACSFSYDSEGRIVSGSFTGGKMDNQSFVVYYDDGFLRVTGVSLASPSLQLATGESHQLIATITPADASVQAVKWYSSDASVATVDNNGLVTAVAPGTATITVKTVNGGFEAGCVVTVAGMAVPEAVDLGLPSGLKWASFNVGASAPGGYGNYYAWGETQTKSDYSWETYTFGSSPNGPLSKYNYDYSYGPVDNKVVLDPEDDVAHVEYGGSWRIPTASEWDELLNHCTWTWTNDYNGTGVAGDIVTSNRQGYTHVSIFLPAAGRMTGTYLDDDRGQYWSSSLCLPHTMLVDEVPHPGRSLNIRFSSFESPSWRRGNRGGEGAPVRAVYGNLTPVAAVSLNSSSLQLFKGESQQLAVSVTPAGASNKAIKWYSSDPSVATVENNGLVSAVAPGTATVTVETYDGGFTASCDVTVQAKASPEAVDLGLSSGIKWASVNIGASDPEEYGDYYAWGEREIKSNYSWSTYMLCDGSSISLTKYNINSSYGAVDNKIVLDPKDDVAHEKLGGNWRMPTDDEWTELRNDCTWTWTVDYNGTGISGMIVTASNDKNIFLPAAGRCSGENFSAAGSYGYYWSSSLAQDKSYNALSVSFRSDRVSRSGSGRYYGFCVRPVLE